MNGLGKPIKKSLSNFIKHNIIPLLKNNYVKHFWENLKKIIIAIFDIDSQISDHLVTFLMTSPSKIPQN